MKPYLYLIIILLLASNCKEDEPANVIDIVLRPFVESFVEEAAKRGLLLEIDDLQAELVDHITVTGGSDICGYGWSSYRGTDQIRVEIKNTDFCWNDRTYIEKENFMFHELGHAYLSRIHFAGTFPNGSPKSIMCSNNDLVGCSNFSTYYDNEPFRKYYLDELFNRNTPEPDFVNRTDFVKTVFQEGSSPFITDWEIFTNQDEPKEEDYSFSTDLTDNSIRLSINNPSEEEFYIIIVKEYELGDFTPCSNLKASMDISLDGLEDGYFTVAQSLMGEEMEDSFNRIYLNLNQESENGDYDNYVNELYCVAEQTQYVSVSFGLRSKNPVSMKVSNLQIDLFE